MSRPDKRASGHLIPCARNAIPVDPPAGPAAEDFVVLFDAVIARLRVIAVQEPSEAACVLGGCCIARLRSDVQDCAAALQQLRAMQMKLAGKGVVSHADVGQIRP